MGEHLNQKSDIVHALISDSLCCCRKKRLCLGMSGCGMSVLCKFKIAGFSPGTIFCKGNKTGRLILLVQVN